MLAPSPPRDGDGLGPAVGGAGFHAVGLIGIFGETALWEKEKGQAAVLPVRSHGLPGRRFGPFLIRLVSLAAGSDEKSESFTIVC
jgi:hypothetical protein